MREGLLGYTSTIAAGSWLEARGSTWPYHQKNQGDFVQPLGCGNDYCVFRCAHLGFFHVCATVLAMEGPLRHVDFGPGRNSRSCVLTCAALGRRRLDREMASAKLQPARALDVFSFGRLRNSFAADFLIDQFAFARLAVLLIVVPCCLTSIPYARQLYAGAEPWQEAIRRVPALPLLMIAALTIFTALTNLAEIAGDSGNDTVAYHLLGPKLWVQNGLIRCFSDPGSPEESAIGSAVAGPAGVPSHR
jgi:hypothetical protein